jgi:D-glycero-D-manno-heptose 1,7-bisphosphate phosphatase
VAIKLPDNQPGMKRAVFLDRDGVINRKLPEGEYVTRWEDFHFLPRVGEAISLLNKAGWSVIVISNQRCVALRLLTIEDLDAIHRNMRDELAAVGAELNGIYYCPHDKEPPCACRKPLPGMLLTAAREHQIDLASSWLIGDSDSDVEAGKRAGCKTVRIIEEPTIGDRSDCWFARSLFEASNKILGSSTEIA